MRKEELLGEVKKRFKVINKLKKRLIEDFDRDMIHDFRVEVKKLRALLRLISVENNNKLPGISKKMKTFYGYAGIIRNIQIQLQSVKNYAETNKQPIPAQYISLLENEANSWKKEMTELMQDNNFYDDEDKIVSNLPDRLTKTSIKQFITNKIAELQEHMLHYRSDERLHDVRKVLKDLLYTWPYIHAYVALPGIINNKESIDLLTTIIGNFNDTRLKLNFLTDEYLRKIEDENEKALLRQLAEKTSTEKDSQRKIIETYLPLET